jgi:hypothetical protein
VIASSFLRAKHWQVFLLLAVFPTIVRVAVLLVIEAKRSSWHDFAPLVFAYRGMMVFWFLCILAWLGSLGLFLSSLEKTGLSTDAPVFRSCLAYSGLCFPILIYKVPFLTQFTLLLRLILIACSIYLLYFVSRELVRYENDSSPSFSEHAKYFLFLWIFVAGVWVIQPKINELYGKMQFGSSSPD